MPNFKKIALIAAGMATSSQANCGTTVTVSGVTDSTTYQDYPNDSGIEPWGFGWPNAPELAFANGNNCPDFTLKESDLNGEYTDTGETSGGQPVYTRKISGIDFYLYYDTYPRYTHYKSSCSGTCSSSKMGQAHGWAIGKSMGPSCVSESSSCGGTSGSCCGVSQLQSRCCLDGNSGCTLPVAKQGPAQETWTATKHCSAPGNTVQTLSDLVAGGSDVTWNYHVARRPLGSSSSTYDGYAYMSYSWYCFSNRGTAPASTRGPELSYSSKGFTVACSEPQSPTAPTLMPTRLPTKLPTAPTEEPCKKEGMPCSNNEECCADCEGKGKNKRCGATSAPTFSPTVGAPTAPTEAPVGVACSELSHDGAPCETGGTCVVSITTHKKRGTMTSYECV